MIATRLIQHDFGQVTAEGFEWFAGTNGEADYCDCDPGLVDLAYDAAVTELGEDHVFKGIIASGDQFIASEAYVRRLQEDFDAVACEKAHETYENLVELAADQSGRIVLRMLHAMNDLQ